MFPLFSRLRPPHSHFRRGSFVFLSSLSAATLPTYLILNSDSLPSPAAPLEQPLKALIRSYVVYSLCSIPALVDTSPKLLDTLARIPGLKQLTYGLVKVTFFDQFVGGESAGATLPLLRALRAANKGALFSYSVEVNESEALGSSTTGDGFPHGGSGIPAHKRIVQEILNCIDVAADFEDSFRGSTSSLALSSSVSDKGRRTWVAIKLTAMLPNAHALINFSKYITSARQSMNPMVERPSASAHPPSYERLQDISHGREALPVEAIPFPGCPIPGDMDIILSQKPTTRLSVDPNTNSSPLPVEDIDDLNELYNDLVKICTRAQERGVKVIFDAEYSWYQPALDALIYSLMRQFNALPSSNSNPNPIHHHQVQPLVYATYQAYLRRTPLHLAYTLHDARQNNYALGVKLVRGAYHPHEVSAHGSPSDLTKNGDKSSLSISPEPLPPVWLTKADTDKAYNECVELLVAAVKDDIHRDALVLSPNEQEDQPKTPLHTATTGSWATGIFRWLKYSSPAHTPPTSLPSVISKRPQSPPRYRQGQVGVGVLFGTHNWESCNVLLDQLIKSGLGKVVTETNHETGGKVEKVALSQDVTERVAVGQLYGMCDDLTDSIVSRTVSSSPLAIKYVPYGGLAEVLPYLSRRAIENKSVLDDGGAVRERRRAGREIAKRVKGWFGVPTFVESRIV